MNRFLLLLTLAVLPVSALAHPGHVHIVPHDKPQAGIDPAGMALATLIIGVVALALFVRSRNAGPRDNKDN